MRPKRKCHYALDSKSYKCVFNKRVTGVMELSEGFPDEQSDVSKCEGLKLDSRMTRNLSGDEIANVNFLCDEIVHALKIQ